MSEPVYFLKLEMENVRCFGETAVLDLSDGKGNWRQWTVILGDNGTGKTTILQILYALQQVKSTMELLWSRDVNHDRNEKEDHVSPLGFSLASIVDYNYNIFSDAVNNNKKGHAIAEVSIQSNNDFLSIPTSVLYFSSSIISGCSPSTDLRLLGLYCYGYGASRKMSFKRSELDERKGDTSLFNDYYYLINAEEWLLQLDYVASKDSDIQQYAQKRREQVKVMLIELLPDVTEIRFTEPTKENLKSTVQFKTELSGWVSIHQLSLGYKTMVAWMVDLAARLFERYPDSDNPLAEPAIVLVDEIDLHMHPKWQRKIFDYLTERFPKTQFVVTAHSPLVVQAAPEDANIVLLKKEGDHVVIDNDIQSVHNWRLDQIMSSDLFGIDSTRGPETEKWLAERKGLLQKQELTTGEQERLTELNEKSRSLPTADTAEDINAMDIIRKAAEYLQSQKA
jgi:predicted ATP-binding protein involved in virulence